MAINRERPLMERVQYVHFDRIFITATLIFGRKRYPGSAGAQVGIIQGVVTLEFLIAVEICLSDILYS